MVVFIAIAHVIPKLGIVTLNVVLIMKVRRALKTRLNRVNTGTYFPTITGQSATIQTDANLNQTSYSTDNVATVSQV